jgi:HSP20 family protein
LQTDDATIIYCELPGVAKEDVKVDYNDGVLTISGERQSNKVQHSSYDLC